MAVFVGLKVGEAVVLILPVARRNKAGHVERSAGLDGRKGAVYMRAVLVFHEVASSESLVADAVVLNYRGRIGGYPGLVRSGGRQRISVGDGRRIPVVAQRA